MLMAAAQGDSEGHRQSRVEFELVRAAEVVK